MVRTVGAQQNEAMNRPVRRWRSIGREWRHQRLAHPRSLRTMVLIWLV